MKDVFIPKPQQSLELPERGVDHLPLPPGLRVVLEVRQVVPDLYEHPLGVAVRVDDRKVAHETALEVAGDVGPGHEARVLEYLAKDLVNVPDAAGAQLPPHVLVAQRALAHDVVTVSAARGAHHVVPGVVGGAEAVAELVYEGVLTVRQPQPGPLMLEGEQASVEADVTVGVIERAESCIIRNSITCCLCYLMSLLSDEHSF